MNTATRSNKSGRSVSNQPGTSRSTKTPKLYRPSGSFPFPQARGKTVEDVYVTIDSDMNFVTLRFADNTQLVIDIEPCLSFAAEYSKWKTGNERIIKRWPRIRST